MYIVLLAIGVTSLAAATPPTVPATPPPPSIVAVLEVKSAEAIKGVARGYLSDLIRTAVHHEVPQLRVITRENMIVLLSNEKSLADCESECEVETGRRIGAELVITAEASQVDGAPRLMLKLFDTRGQRWRPVSAIPRCTSS